METNFFHIKTSKGEGHVYVRDGSGEICVEGSIPDGTYDEVKTRLGLGRQPLFSGYRCDDGTTLIDLRVPRDMYPFDQTVTVRTVTKMLGKRWSESLIKS